MRLLALLLPLVLAQAPVLAAQVEHAPRQMSVTGEFGTGSPVLQPHPLRSQGLALGLWSAPLRSTELVSPERQQARLNPLNGAKRGVLVGGVIFGGLALLLVASDGELTGEEAANTAVHTVAGALTGALVGLIVGVVGGT